MHSTVQNLKWLVLQITLFLLLVSPSLLITYYSYTQLYNQLTAQTLSERKSLARQMALAVESRLDTARDIGVVTAANIAPIVEKGEWDAATKELAYTAEGFPYADRVFLTDKKGVLKGIYPPSPENIGKDFSFRDWYKGVSNNWQPYASEVFKRAPIPQFNTVAVAVPVKDVKGNPIGVFGLAMNLDSFYKLTKSFSVGEGGFLYIVNQKGQIVAHPKYPALGEIIDFHTVPVVQKLLDGKNGAEVLYNPIEKENRLVAYEIVPKYNWGVVVADPLTGAFITRDTALRSLSIIYSLIFLLNCILAITVLYVLNRLKKSQETLRLSYELYDLVTKATNDAIYDWYVPTNKIHFSDGIQRLFGYTKDQVKDDLSWWSDHIHPEDKDRVNALVDEMIKGKDTGITIDYRFAKADGTYAYVQDRAYLIRDKDGQPLRYVGVLEDISANKQHEGELNKRTQELEQRNKELGDLNEVMVGRELKMEALEKEIEELKKKVTT